jgi:NTP pyrophosphatase (non-canonical NTP hydrolase)
MTLDEYQVRAISTLTTEYEYGDFDAQLMGQILGLVGESGEVAEKVKKLQRDKKGRIAPADKAEILKELGDILWYVNAVSHLLGSSLSEVAQANLDKLASRKTRDALHGSGDNR